MYRSEIANSAALGVPTSLRRGPASINRHNRATGYIIFYPLRANWMLTKVI